MSSNPVSSSEAGRGSPSTNPVVLVVDDNVVNLKLMVGMLRAAGFDPRPATDGATALRAYDKVQPAAVVLDVRMPGIDGFEVCRRLRAQALSRDVPILFLTAELSPETRQACVAAGGTACLEKPVDERQLMQLLRQVTLG